MSLKTQLLLFFAAVACMAAAMGVHDSVFNNFLNDTFQLTADQRGWLEFPRELPGFLTVLMTGVLASLAVTRLAVVASAMFLGGLVGIALLGASYPMMVTMMMIASAGMHLLQPVGGSIALGLSEASNRGRRMGQMGSVGTAGTVFGTGTVLLLLDKSAPHYVQWFLVAAALGGAAGVIYACMHIPHLNRPRPRMVVRRRFSLYYLLEFVFGARKQIFLTFGPWVLIKVYGAAATSIAGLLMTAAIIGIFFQPVVGYLIDRFGERRIMILDGSLLVFVCLGYGYAFRSALGWSGSTEHALALALPVASACFVADNLLFALGSARAAYLSRLTDSPEEITSTLAMGVSINHIASMTIPAVAGYVWMTFGYERVFAAGAVLAAGQALLALLVPRRGARPKPTPVAIPAGAPLPAAE